MSDLNREAYLQSVEKRALLDGRFEKLVRLGPAGGNGNFSLLFTANDRQTNTEVVLKFFHPDERHDSYRWDCFEREVKVLQRLDGQKDIIRLVAPRSEFIETFTAGPVSMKVPFAYYAIERAASDLAELINCGSPTAEDILAAFLQMCRAVQRIHRRNVVHRDLKPRNFLVMGSGEVKLTDFGTARCLDRDPPAAFEYLNPPGDLRYSALELLAGVHDEDPTIAFGADLFALGATLFELFTGTRLSSIAFDASMTNDLKFLTRMVKRGRRKDAFDSVIGNISNSHPLPTLRALGPVVPGCVLPLVDEMYQSMAAVDYRRRLCDFERIFLKINACILVLRNEKKYACWNLEKCKRRAAARDKRQRVGVRA